MKSLALWISVSAALLIGMAGADASFQTDARLVQVQGEPVQEDQGRLRKAGFDRRDWRKRLMAIDLDQREESLDRLVVLAQTSEDAREALEEWSQDRVEIELAWSARIALRMVARKPKRNTLDPLMIRPDMDVFDLFDLDRKRIGLDRDRFGSLDELQKLLESMLDPRSQRLQPPKGGLSWQSRSGFKMESGPKGVRIEVDVDEKGERTTKIFEGESLEQLLQDHPELKEHGVGLGLPRLGAGLPDGFEIFRSPGRIEIAPRKNQDQSQAKRQVQGGLRTDILGVMMHEPEADEKVVEGLPLGVGLSVERTVPGTIAHILKLRRGDILTDLNGTELRSGEDVSQALREREADAPVHLKVIDEVGALRTLTWKPEPANK
ncbi:MAG: hypothetical protein ACI835_002729 [Planctomycetota bacterium]|jgi:hypothetical protein